MMSSVRLDGCDLYYEEAGNAVSILLIPPGGHHRLNLGSRD